MARTIEQIQANIIADVQAQPELSGTQTNNSRRAIWRLFTFVQASAILILEQIIDVFKAENEVVISQAIPATEAWIAKKAFEFQYSAVTPQVIQLDNFYPVYPVKDDNLKIVTRCSVQTTISNKVIIKIAKQEPRPGVLVIFSSAPCRCSTCLTMARPKPVPPVSRERLRSTR